MIKRIIMMPILMMVGIISIFVCGTVGVLSTFRF